MQRTVPPVRQIHLIFRKCGKSDFNARTGVLRLELSGNNEDDDDQTYVIRDRFIMDTDKNDLQGASQGGLRRADGHLWAIFYSIKTVNFLPFRRPWRRCEVPGAG